MHDIPPILLDLVWEEPYLAPCVRIRLDSHIWFDLSFGLGPKRSTLVCLMSRFQECSKSGMYIALLFDLRTLLGNVFDPIGTW